MGREVQVPVDRVGGGRQNATMNGMYGQNDGVNVTAGIIPYAPPMLPMGSGGDSLFQIAWRGKWFILFSVIAGLGGAYGYYRTLQPQYVSTSRILVSVPEQRLQPDIPQPAISKPNLLTQASMITSPAIINAAMRDPNVLSTSMNIGDDFKELLSTLSAKVGKDDIINVTASSPYPKAAAALVNAVVQGYIAWHAQNREDSAEEYLADLKKQADQVARELKSKRLEKMQAEQRTPEVVDSASGGIVSKTLDMLKKEYVDALLYAVQQRSYRDRLVSLESDPNRLRQYIMERGASGEDLERSKLTTALYETQLQLDELSAGGVVQLSQITLLKNRKNQLRQRVAELDNEFMKEHVELAKSLCADANDRERQLKRLYEDELRKTEGYGEEKARYEFLVAECDILDKQFTTLNEQISNVRPGSRKGVNIYVLEKAEPATKPSAQMARVMGIGLVLGLMVGGGLAFLRDWRDQTVRSADEITAILGVPILGAVPTIPRRGILRRGPRSRLAAHTREFEAYRSIRTALFFGSICEEAKTLLVTSPGPLEGKTTLVSNLGIAMARTGQKTLIVDADLRKPMQHRVFAKKGPQGKGLVDVLSGTATLDEAIRPTEIEGLDVLESGQIAPNPSELLGSEAFWALFERLKGRYDRILVDSPPVGIVADAQILASRCGLTLLVLRAQRSSRLVTQRAREALSTVSARVVGAVVNDVPKGDTRYSHYGSGAHSYYYGSHEPTVSRPVRKELPLDLGSQDGNESSEAKERG